MVVVDKVMLLLDLVGVLVYSQILQHFLEEKKYLVGVVPEKKMMGVMVALIMV
jgi:hypothetical protein